jgi:hypothetical protein
VKQYLDILEQHAVESDNSRSDIPKRIAEEELRMSRIHFKSALLEI